MLTTPTIWTSKAKQAWEDRIEGDYERGDLMNPTIAPDIDRILADLGKQLIANAGEERGVTIPYPDAVQLSLWATMHRDGEIMEQSF